MWPENWPAFILFSQMATQWFVGMGGPTGLRYESLYPRLDRFTTSSEEWDAMFDDIRVMEHAALEAMQES